MCLCGGLGADQMAKPLRQDACVVVLDGVSARASDNRCIPNPLT
jgi:hypothetical protein